MSEFVEFRCEEWVSEIEKLEKLRLFDSREIKTLATRRREFEYKLERRTKSKEDFLRYIQFEVDLLRLISFKRKKTGIKSGKKDIENKQIKRIIRLFKQIIFRSPADVKLWMSLFKFCIEIEDRSVISTMLAKMLQYHADKPELWIYASKWESKHGNSYSNARKYLMKALRHHPSSDKLHLELFKMELEYRKKKIKLKAKKLKKNQWIFSEVDEDIIKGKLIDVVYKFAISAISSPEFKVELLNIIREFDEEIHLEKIILRDLMECHPEAEITWDTIARRAYEGLSCDYDNLKEDKESKEVDENLQQAEKNTFEERLQKSVSIYKMAVERLNTSKMWHYYLDHVIKVYASNNQDAKFPSLESKIVQNAMEGALSSGHLTEEHLLSWINLFKKSDLKNKFLEDILLKGTQIYPKNLPLWHARVRYYLSRDDEKTGRRVFEEAIKEANQKAPLWDLMIEYYQLKNSGQLEEIFKKGLNEHGEVAQALKPRYLEWLATQKGLDEVRKIFETVEFKHPPCLELYQIMLKIESEQENIDVERIRKCHELIVSYFGQNEPRVWLNFINWEMEKGDVTTIHKIHRRALNSLSSEKLEDFLTEYNFIKMNSS